MPKFTKSCQKLPKVVNSCKNMPKYAKSCPKLPKVAKIGLTQENASGSKELSDIEKINESESKYEKEKGESGAGSFR